LEEPAVGSEWERLGGLRSWASGGASRARWEMLGRSQGSRNAGKTTRLLRDSFEFMGNRDLSLADRS